MATALVSISVGSTATLVTAQSGKIIRLRRLITSKGPIITIKSDDTALLPELLAGSSNFIDMSFTPGTVATAAGEALKATIVGANPVTAWIDYDVV